VAKCPKKTFWAFSNGHGPEAAPMQPGSTQDQGSTRSARIRCSLRTADAATADRGTRHRDATRSPGLPGGWAAALGPSRLAARCLVAASIGLAGGTALGDDRVPAEFRGADLALGERLIRENKCSECHIRRVGGDGNAIYRPDRPDQPARRTAGHGGDVQHRIEAATVPRRRAGDGRGAAARSLPLQGNALIHGMSVHQC
jgi:hypothetical protein